MLATAIIVFREVLEAALIVGIVLAASKGVPRRGWWVAGGILGGVLGASLVAACADRISSFAEGMGQELFNASILFAAVLMLGWHTVWMGRHGRELAAHMSAVGKEVVLGRRPLYGLAVVVGVAVLREGFEIVLFLYGIAVTGDDNTLTMLLGGLIGLATGAAAGTALYRGLLRIPSRYLFNATSTLVVLLAAGMAAQGADFLIQAGLLPSLGQQIWDSSRLLSDHSLGGRVLHTLIGYVDRPSGLQLLFYGATIAVIVGLTKAVGRLPQPSRLAAAEDA